MVYHYTLVTEFNDYWEDFGEREGSYPLRLLKGDTASSSNIFVPETPTTFVKIDPVTRQPLKVWSGSVYDFRETTSRIYFKIRLEAPIEQNNEHKLESGFYIRSVEEKIGVVDPNVIALSSYSVTGEKSVQSDIRPAIFDDLLKTTDWKKFELYTYYLIKLLGIHNAYSFDPQQQSGKADGFFKFGNLAVLYDCTLRSNYEETKRMQIENYCKQLEVGQIEAAPMIIEGFHHYQKQVWLITRGKSRLLQTRNDIAIKEVGVDKLINLYEFRLRNAFGTNQLENELRTIELEEK